MILSTKNTCESERGIVPFLERSRQTVMMMPGIPPMMPEISRADLITLERSAGLGEIAEERPQKGISPIV